MTEREMLEHDLREAVAAERIVPYFQPIVSLSDRRLLGFEILARWAYPERGFVPPAEFIPLADDLGLLDSLLDQLMRTAFAAAQDWPHHLFLGFNVSPTQLHDRGLAARVEQAAADHDFSTTRVHIEVTESAFIDDLARSNEIIQMLLELGCVVAMDDFGTGYSSLTWLSSLPFSKLKIDAQFVRAMTDHRQSRKIVSAVIGLGRSLGLAVVAEGVERVSEAEMLRQLGCELAQGFLFSPPVPASEVPTLLAADAARPEADAQQPRLPMSAELRAFQLSEIYKSDLTAIAFTDPGGTVMKSSAAFDSLMDAHARDVTGRRIGEFIPVTRETLAELRALDLMGYSSPAFEETTARGALVLIVIRPVKDEDRELLGFSIVCADITHRGLSPSVPPVAEMQTGTGQVDTGWSWQLDGKGLVVDVDDPDTPDRQQHTALGVGWMDYVHPEDVQGALGAWAEAVATGKTYDVKLRLHNGDGRYEWHRMRTSPEFGVDGAVISWHGRCERIVSALQEPLQHEVLDALSFSFDYGAGLQWIAAADGTLTRLSAALKDGWSGRRQALGTTTRDAHRVRLYEYLPAVDLIGVRHRYEFLLGAAEPFELSYEVFTTDGETAVACCRAVPRRQADGAVTAWHGAFTIVTAGPV
ncbi:EAL domain-containing protein [Mycolicibacterium sp. OfavD-34-C]|uniref:EAL domain-containing protein n=1 Tax=Mycolicibacterium sp. OfavD-34-C TaxID=2917746 RepID=UPI001EF4F637|nr:EAL domain-containing protein [Mycolicibacterium sp. OfavD-34-C]MCG7579598.1 EAL domain-containing protein [Mycolicibacterium sp. OfavD-34-C]